MDLVKVSRKLEVACADPVATAPRFCSQWLRDANESYSYHFLSFHTVSVAGGSRTETHPLPHGGTDVMKQAPPSVSATLTLSRSRHETERRRYGRNIYRR